MGHLVNYHFMVMFIGQWYDLVECDGWLSLLQVGYVFGKGGSTIAEVKSKAGVTISTDVSDCDDL